MQKKSQGKKQGEKVVSRTIPKSKIAKVKSVAKKSVSKKITTSQKKVNPVAKKISTSSILKKNINSQYLKEKTITEVSDEMKAGFAILKKVKQPLATFYGSHHVYKHDYKACQQIVQMLGKHNFGIVSGGGTGIMEAANSQAVKQQTLSIGFRGSAFKEEHVDAKIYTYQHSFKYVFVRRFMLCIRSNVLFFFPGGYGTLNELMEILVLMQSNIIDRVPIILVNKKFWKGLDEWFDYLALDKKIKKEDIELMHIVNTVTEVETILFGK
jgi:uncharacterized protein (TIGR00730 family)